MTLLLFLISHFCDLKSNQWRIYNFCTLYSLRCESDCNKSESDCTSSWKDIQFYVESLSEVNITGISIKFYSFYIIYVQGCAITGDNQIYLAGGSIRKLNYRGSVTTEGVSNSFYVFDQIEKSWTSKAKMNMSRSQFSLVIVDGYVHDILLNVMNYRLWDKIGGGFFQTILLWLNCKVNFLPFWNRSPNDCLCFM